MSENQPKTMTEIAANTKYPLDAFKFVRRGLDHTVDKIHKNPEALSEFQRHVDGRQLSEGLKEFAIENYGHMAITTLKRWKITRTEDFGEIVFAMVNAGLMQATDDDRLDHFINVYDFETAFERPISMKNTQINYRLNLGKGDSD